MEEDKRSVDRRKLLRRASVVAAGVGAAGVAAAVNASPAAAAAGSPVTAGQTVDAGTASTSITNDSAANATLTLANPNGAALQLVPANGHLASDVVAGSFNALANGDLEYQHLPGFLGEVYTSQVATQTWPVTPFRALDTRGLGGVNHGTGKEQILNPGVLNSAGQLPANQTLLLNLTAFVKYGWAVIGNATMQGPQGQGFLTVWPAGVNMPNTSSVNFLPGWPVSNVVFCALGEQNTTDQTDVLQIFTSTTTHIIFDVTGFVVPTIYNINSDLLPFVASPNSKAGAQPGRPQTRGDRVRAYRPNH